MKDLCFVTGNLNKFKEVKKLVKTFNLISLNDLNFFDEIKEKDPVAYAERNINNQVIKGLLDTSGEWIPFNMADKINKPPKAKPIHPYIKEAIAILVSFNPKA